MTPTLLYDPPSATEYLATNAPPSRPVPVRALLTEGDQCWWLAGTCIHDGTVTKVGELVGVPVYSVNGTDERRYQVDGRQTEYLGQTIHPKTAAGRASLLVEIDAAITSLQLRRANLLREDLA